MNILFVNESSTFPNALWVISSLLHFNFKGKFCPIEMLNKYCWMNKCINNLIASIVFSNVFLFLFFDYSWWMHRLVCRYQRIPSFGGESLFASNVRSFTVISEPVLPSPKCWTQFDVVQKLWSGDFEEPIAFDGSRMSKEEDSICMVPCVTAGQWSLCLCYQVCFSSC